MPSDNRKTITVPVATYERFKSLHHRIRPHESAPQWWSVNELIDIYEAQE
jgi:uncharacterized protein (DUF2384 family)